MVWNRNEGQNENEIIQNKFTAYLLRAVKRRRALYIEQAVHEAEAIEKAGEAFVEKPFDLEDEAFKDAPVYMKLQNEKLYEALLQLSEREQYVFFNRVLDEKTFDQLAVEMGLSYKCVSTVYYRAVQRIKKRMRGGETK